MSSPSARLPRKSSAGFENADQVGEAVHHLLALAELVRVVEIGDIDDALEIVGLGEFG